MEKSRFGDWDDADDEEDSTDSTAEVELELYLKVGRPTSTDPGDALI